MITVEYNQTDALTNDLMTCRCTKLKQTFHTAIVSHQVISAMECVKTQRPKFVLYFQTHYNPVMYCD